MNTRRHNTKLLISKNRNLKIYLNGFEVMEFMRIADIVQAHGGKISIPDNETLVLSKSKSSPVMKFPRFNIKWLWDSIEKDHRQDVGLYLLPEDNQHFSTKQEKKEPEVITIEDDTEETPEPLHQTETDDDSSDDSIQDPSDTPPSSSNNPPTAKNSIDIINSERLKILPESQNPSTEFFIRTSGRPRKITMSKEFETSPEFENMMESSAKEMSRKTVRKIIGINGRASDSSSDEEIDDEPEEDVNNCETKKRKMNTEAEETLELNFWHQSERLDESCDDSIADFSDDPLSLLNNEDQHDRKINMSKESETPTHHHKNSPTSSSEFEQVKESSAKRLYRKYSIEENQKMLNYIIDTSAFDRTHSVVFWKNCVEHILPERTPMGLLGHFKRYLGERVGSYIRDPDILDAFEAVKKRKIN